MPSSARPQEAAAEPLEEGAPGPVTIQAHVGPAPSGSAPSAAGSEPTFDVRRHPAPLRWQSWPPRDEPGPTLILLAMILAAGGAVLLATSNVWIALAAAAILAATTGRHWTATTYETGREGLRIETRGGLRRLRWNLVDRWYEGPRGVWLVAPRRPLPWDLVGGVFCPWPRERDILRQTLTYYLGPATGAAPEGRVAGDGQQPAPGTPR